MEAHRVLVVEDDPELRESLTAGLEAAGLQVVAVADGTSALDKLSNSVFGAICLDVILPEVSGYDVCEQIRQSARHRTSLVVMMSARAYPADCANALEAGADVFLAKPFEIKTLVDTLRLSTRRLSHEAVA